MRDKSSRPPQTSLRHVFIWSYILLKESQNLPPTSYQMFYISCTLAKGGDCSVLEFKSKNLMLQKWISWARSGVHHQARDFGWKPKEMASSDLIRHSWAERFCALFSETTFLFSWPRGHADSIHQSTFVSNFDSRWGKLGIQNGYTYQFDSDVLVRVEVLSWKIQKIKCSYCGYFNPSPLQCCIVLEHRQHKRQKQNNNITTEQIFFHISEMDLYCSDTRSYLYV